MRKRVHLVGHSHVYNVVYCFGYFMAMENVKYFISYPLKAYCMLHAPYRYELYI